MYHFMTDVEYLELYINGFEFITDYAQGMKSISFFVWASVYGYHFQCFHGSFTFRR